MSLVALCAALAGCDASFDAFEDTGRTYSVFGYLDGNADRQVVRVEPLRDSTFAGSSADPLGVRVTTENTETGETAVWDEQIVRVGANDDVPVHNFTTEADLQPGATYRFRVEREEEEGTTTSAEVTLPPAFPELTVVNPPDLTDPMGPTVLRAEGIEDLGGVRAEYDYESCVPAPRGPVCRRRQTAAFHLADTTRKSNGALKIEIDWVGDIPENPAAFRRAFYSFEVTVAAASEDWPTYAEDNPPGGGPQGQPLPPPGIGTNIEGGTGFLGGAFTRTVDIPITRR